MAKAASTKIYEPKRGIILLCSDAADQQATYERLKAEHPERKLRVVTA